MVNENLLLHVYPLVTISLLPGKYVTTTTLILRRVARTFTNAYKMTTKMLSCNMITFLAAIVAVVGQQNQQFDQGTPQQPPAPPPNSQQFNNQPPPPQQQQFNNQPPPPQQQQFNNQPPPPQQQQFNNQPPPQQQQQFNNQPPPQQQQQFNNKPPPQQQQFNNPPPPQQQQFNNQPPPQQQQQQFAQPNVRPPPPPPPQQQQQQQQQQQRFAPGVPPPQAGGQHQQQFNQQLPPQQQQQARMAPGVPPPQQQQQVRMAPGVPPPQQQQQVRMAPGVPPPQQQQQQQIKLPPGVSPQQFAAMQQQQQQQQQQQGMQQPQFPPGHAANIAPPTPPPPPAQDGPITSSNWLDAAPGIAMEYKVHVDAGKEDCYWQYVHPGATLYVSYQVLKGGDGSIGMAVRNPAMQVVHPYAWKANSEYEESAAQGGYYSVCLDNQFSRFSAKLVNLYLTTFRYDEWEKFSLELQDMDVTVENFTQTLRSVDQRIQVMRQFQTMSRGSEARDFNLLADNSSYVQTWSAAQCLVVVLCTVVQVYFVKSFFRDPRDTKSGGGNVKMRT